MRRARPPSVTYTGLCRAVKLTVAWKPAGQTDNGEASRQAKHQATNAFVRSVWPPRLGGQTARIRTAYFA
jgi:hypothetical protein